MGFFRFRRSIKLFPGVRWNFGKRSSSLSIGGRGAHYTFGTAGSRTTVGIPGTGLSYTDIHSTHTRVARQHAGVPLPTEEWLQSHVEKRKLHIPDRRPDEPPIRKDQLEQFSNFKHVNFQGYDFSALGSDQADDLLRQLRYHQKEVSKSLLKKFYAGHGHAISDAYIDHCYDHPDKPWVEPNRKGHGCLILLGILLLIGWLNNLNKKSDAPASTSDHPTPIATTPSSSSPGQSSSAKSPDPAYQLPAQKFWPTEVRISAPVELAGTVDGGTIHQIAKPGAVLDATLSEDHKTVTLKRLDISGKLPIGETDFVERARKAETGE